MTSSRREMTVTTAIGHGKLAVRAIDAYLRGEQYEHPRPPPSLPPSKSSTPGTTRTPRDRPPAASMPPGVSPPSTRWSGASTPRPRCSKPAGACRAATASSATTASASAPTTRSSSWPGGSRQGQWQWGQGRRPRCTDVGQWGRRQALLVRLRLLQGLRPVRSRVPLRGYRHGARADIAPGPGLSDRAGRG